MDGSLDVGVVMLLEKTVLIVLFFFQIYIYIFYYNDLLSLGQIKKNKDTKKITKKSDALSFRVKFSCKFVLS